MRPEEIKLVANARSFLDIVANLSNRLSLNINISKSGRIYTCHKINACSFAASVLQCNQYGLNSYRAQQRE